MDFVESRNLSRALHLIEETKPDVVVADVNMPQMNGLELARKIKETYFQTALVFLTMHKDEAMFNAAMDTGVHGYVLKDNAVTDINDCIKTVAAGKHYITPALSDFLFNRSGKTPLSKSRPAAWNR